MHQKSVIKVQTFRLAGAEARSTREKPRSGEHMCARPEGEHDFGPKSFQMRSGRGVPYQTLENIAFERRERRPVPTGKPQEEPGNPTQRGIDDGSLKTKHPQIRK